MSIALQFAFSKVASIGKKRSGSCSCGNGEAKKVSHSVHGISVSHGIGISLRIHFAFSSFTSFTSQTSNGFVCVETLNRWPSVITLLPSAAILSVTVPQLLFIFRWKRQKKRKKGNEMKNEKTNEKFECLFSFVKKPLPFPRFLRTLWSKASTWSPSRSPGSPLIFGSVRFEERCVDTLCPVRVNMESWKLWSNWSERTSS